MVTKQQDEGFSLIELLLVTVVLGVLATIVVASVGGFSSEAEDTGCKSDAHVLATAVEAYFAQFEVDVIAAADAGPDGFERTLADAGFLRSPSSYHDLDADGRLIEVTGSPCSI